MKFESLILGLGIGLHFGLQRVGWEVGLSLFVARFSLLCLI